MSRSVEREEACSPMVAACENMQFPKGMSTSEELYVHGRDRGRGLANRAPVMSYIVIDEEGLDLEGRADPPEALAVRYEKLLERWNLVAHSAERRGALVVK